MRFGSYFVNRWLEVSNRQVKNQLSHSGFSYGNYSQGSWIVQFLVNAGFYFDSYHLPHTIK